MNDDKATIDRDGQEGVAVFPLHGRPFIRPVGNPDFGSDTFERLLDLDGYPGMIDPEGFGEEDVVLRGGKIENDAQVFIIRAALYNYAFGRRKKLGMGVPPGAKGTGFETEDDWFDALVAGNVALGFRKSDEELEEEEKARIDKEGNKAGGATIWANAIRRQNRAIKEHKKAIEFVKEHSAGSVESVIL